MFFESVPPGNTCVLIFCEPVSLSVMILKITMAVSACVQTEICVPEHTEGLAAEKFSSGQPGIQICQIPAAVHRTRFMALYIL